MKLTFVAAALASTFFFTPSMGLEECSKTNGRCAVSRNCCNHEFTGETCIDYVCVPPVGLEDEEKMNLIVTSNLRGQVFEEDIN
mmetsp:Transcript_108/g.120  ORF Transcript_108/g.120 Transcript_108/m.120 type:complete len:84 (+) Transcript_108:547-798(+)